MTSNAFPVDNGRSGVISSYTGQSCANGTQDPVYLCALFYLSNTAGSLPLARHGRHSVGYEGGGPWWSVLWRKRQVHALLRPGPSSALLTAKRGFDAHVTQMKVSLIKLNMIDHLMNTGRLNTKLHSQTPSLECLLHCFIALRLWASYLSFLICERGTMTINSQLRRLV